MAERGSSGWEACAEAEEFDRNPKQPMVPVVFRKLALLGGSFPTVRATAVGWDAKRDAVST